jgi:branched-chain amino acid transport system substrate-binding protein
MSKTYYTDGNTSDYSTLVDPGTLEGAQGTIPGAFPNDEFKAQLTAWYADTQGEDLADFSYGPESYDATILAALAALKAKSNVSEDIAKEYANVSGTNGGEECKTYADCAALLKDGKDIHYVGQAGTGPLNDKNEPSSAFIGIYLYDKDNKPVWQQAIEGETSYE